MTEQLFESPEGFTAPDDVDYSTILPDFKDNLHVTIDESGDIEYLLVYSQDEFAVNDGTSGWDSGIELYTSILDSEIRQIRSGLEEKVIDIWEGSEGVDPNGLPWTLDQFSPYFT